MYTEKTHQESPSRTIQSKPGGGRVYMEDNRPEAVRQAKLINTMQQKRTNYVKPILQRTIIPKTKFDLSNKEHVRDLYQRVFKKVKFNLQDVGESLREGIATGFGQPDATWDILFDKHLNPQDCVTMTEVWGEWFGKNIPWAPAAKEDEGSAEEDEDHVDDIESRIGAIDFILPADMVIQIRDNYQVGVDVIQEAMEQSARPLGGNGIRPKLKANRRNYTSELKIQAMQDDRVYTRDKGAVRTFNIIDSGLH